MNGHRAQDVIDYTNNGGNMEERAHPITGEIVALDNILQVTQMWKDVKDDIAALYDLKNQLEQQIVLQAPKPEDSQTAHLETPVGHFTVEYRTKEKWNKKQIQAAAKYLPDLVDNLKISGVYARYLKKLEHTTFVEPEKQQAKQVLFDAKEEHMAKPYIALEDTND